jgi:hypothetical protein
MKTSVVLFVLLLSASLTWAQRPIPPGIRQADKTEDQTQRDLPPPNYRPAPPDMAMLQHDADQLASLAQSIPSDIESINKGLLPKDAIEKLKQVEKLSKHLRSQLTR